MPKLIIANSRTEEMVGDLKLLTKEEVGLGAWGAQRMLWFAEDGDVIVLPWIAEDAYVDYTLGLVDTDRSSLSIVVPPAGFLGVKLLTPDRLRDEGFREELAKALGGRQIDRVLAAYDDDAIVDLAASLGLRSALPGHDFSAQGGGALVNSKAVFRAVAAGVGAPVAEGATATTPERAMAIIETQLASGHEVIVKKAVAGGGFGNEILTRSRAVTPAGSRSVVTLTDQQAVERYVDERWEWMTGGRNAPVVIERYHSGSTTVYAEFYAGPDGCRLMGTGEILMEPIANGEVVPPQNIPTAAHQTLVDGARRLCEAMYSIGYRGTICADAIWTRDGKLLFSETNGRITGSTHLHTAIPNRVIHADHRDRRVRLEHIGWPATSFAEGVAAIRAAGLDYDRTTSTGVVFTGNYVPVNGKIMYCVIAEDFDTAVRIERRIADLTTQERPMSHPAVHSWDEFSTLREIVIGTARNARIPALTDPSAWLNLYPRLNADELAKVRCGDYPVAILEEAEEDLAALADMLRSLGVVVHRPPAGEHSATFGSPEWSSTGFSSYCPRDLVLVYGTALIETPSPTRSRYFETFNLRPLLLDYAVRGAHWLAAPRPRLADDLYEFDEQGLPCLGEHEIAFEAANVVRLGRDILYQVSRSGNEAGLAWLESTLRLIHPKVRVHALRDVYGYTHIDTTIMPLRPGLVLLNPERVHPDRVPSPLRGWDIVWCPPIDSQPTALPHPLSEEWISMNILMVDPYHAIVDSSQPALIAELERHRIEVQPIRSRHAQILGGGFHCVTLDTVRDGGPESYVD